MEDWDLPDTHDTNHHHPSTTAEQMSTLQRRDLREESWDNELEMEAKRDESDQESGRRDGEDRTVTARGVLRFLGLPLEILRHHHLCRSFTIIANIRCLNLFLVLQRPVCSPSQIQLTPIHSRPPLFMVLIHVRYRALHCYSLRAHTRRRRLRKKSRPRPEGMMELIEMDSRYSFSDGEGSRRPPGAIGNGSGDWNASQTSLRLAVGLQRESVMENSPYPSRPSFLLPSMQGISARKMRVSY